MTYSFLTFLRDFQKERHDDIQLVLNFGYSSSRHLPFRPLEGSINYGIKDSLWKENQRFLKDPGCLKNQQMKRFEDNEPTKVLKNDCVSLKIKENDWFLFVRKLPIFMNEFFLWMTWRKTFTLISYLLLFFHFMTYYFNLLTLIWMKDFR